MKEWKAINSKESEVVIMALTKTQISYLENKLDRVISDKLEEVKDKLGMKKDLDKTVLDKLQKGEVQLLDTNNIIEKMTDKLNSYCLSMYPHDLISKEDYNRIQDEYNAVRVKYDEVARQLHKAKTNALDKIVLDGIDVDTALAELNSIEV